MGTDAASTDAPEEVDDFFDINLTQIPAADEIGSACLRRETSSEILAK